jgi:hypothetical protein
MMFAAAVGPRSGRATPSLRDAPQRQSMEIVGREAIYRNRNAVQTNPATSDYVILTPKDMLARDDNWINKHDLIEGFELSDPLISNDRKKSTERPALRYGFGETGDKRG